MDRMDPWIEGFGEIKKQGKGRNDGASLLSLQVLHRAAVIFHLHHEKSINILFSSLLK